jgi:hypothetical protein
VKRVALTGGKRLGGLLIVLGLVSRAALAQATAIQAGT